MPNIHGHTVRECETVCVVDLTGRVANLERNLARGLPWMQKMPRRDGRLAIVGSGPSLRSRLDRLREWNGEIWATNGSYNYLLDAGIVPNAFWGMDPLPGLAEYVRRARPATTFYIAASCDPAVFDVLDGHRIVLWFPIGEDMVYPPDAVVVHGGVTVLTRAPFAGYLMGWRDITLFGADSSFDLTRESRYCYQDGSFAEDSQSPLVVAEVATGERFITEGSLMKQAANFVVMVEQFNGCLHFDCDGLTRASLDAPMNSIDAEGAIIGPSAEWFYGTADAA